MASVAKLLGVEIGEIFKIKIRSSGKIIDNCFFTANELCINDADYPCPSVLTCLLNGTYEIVKLPWKPKEDEHYWTYANRDDDNKTLFIMENIWENDVIDKMFYRLGFCYKTEEEAEADLPRVIKFLNSDDVINWERAVK